MKVTIEIKDCIFDRLIKKVKWSNRLLKRVDNLDLHQRIDKELNKAIDVYLNQKRYNNIFK